MRPTLAQDNLFRTIIHWILVVLILTSIGVGWYLQYQSQGASERAFFVNLHISLGLASVALVGLKILLWLIFSSPVLSEMIPRWQGTIIRNLYLLIYVCVIILGISGFLQATSSAIPIRFWGLQIPAWRAGSLFDLNGLYGALHEATALALTVLVIIQAGILLLRRHQHRKLAYNGEAKRLLWRNREVAPPHIKASLKLIKNLRVFGLIAFWIQLGLAIISALLLLFATSGQTVSPNMARFSSGTLWGSLDFALLCLTIILFFFYPRSARKIALKPERYINMKKEPTPWSLRLSLKISLVGIIAGFAGLGVSIALLIAKTVSQPPGIAITDPSKIVRALDVFIVLINFNLLVAHFIGGAISTWIIILASRAHRALLASPAPLAPLSPLQGRKT